MKLFYTFFLAACLILPSAAQVMLKDINPGSGSSVTYGFANMGAYAYFIADDGTHGNELWRTDGTDTGTQMVIDLNPGVAGGLEYCYPVKGGTQCPDFSVASTDSFIYFIGDEPQHGVALWKTDGTEGGTKFIKTFTTVVSTDPPVLCPINNQMFIRVPSQLWITDGTDTGTHPFLSSRGETIKFDDFSQYGSKFYFPVQFTNTLYASNGTSAGTISYALDSNLIITDYHFTGLWHGGIYFDVLNTITNEPLLYKFDTLTNEMTLIKTFSDSIDGNIYDFMPLDSVMLFILYDITNQNSVWRTDGTNNGTYIISKTDFFDFFECVKYKQRFYYLDTDKDTLLTLYSTDGSYNSNGTLENVHAYPIRGEFGAVGIYGLVFNDKLLFNFIDDVHGRELWTTDGTDFGTGLVKDICPGSCWGGLGYYYTILNNTLLFSSNDGTHGTELWKMDTNFVIQSVHEVEAQQIGIFPNPVVQYLQIQTNNSTNVGEVTIFNLTGEQVFKEISLTGDKILVSNLSAGMYFLQLADKNGNRIGTAKFVKE